MRLSRKELGAELRAVKTAVSSRPGIPALTGALLEASNDGRGLTITATDLEATVRTELEGSAGADGGGWRALVPFKVLTDAIGKGAGDVDIAPESAGSFRAGSATIRTLPIEDFPSIVAAGTYVGRIDAQAFRSAVGAVATAASKDEARPVLTGVLLETEGGGFRMTSTDSYRLHTSEAGGVVVGECKVIVPARALEAVARRIGAKGTGDVVLELADGSVTFRITSSSGSEYRLVSRTIEGEYPNWRQLVPEPAESPNRIRGLAELRAALSSVAPLCRDTTPTRIDVDGYASRLTVSASSPDLGSASETIGADYVGESTSVAFNPSYLGGTFAAVGDDGSWELREALKPGIARSADGRTVALCMPVRLPAPVESPRDVTAEEPTPVEPTHEEREAGAEVSEPEPVSEEPEPPAESMACGCAPGSHPTYSDWHGRHGEPESAPEPPPVDDDGYHEVAEVGRVGRVRVRIVDSRGRRFVDLRVFVESKRYSGPSRKGVMVPLEDAGELSRLLEGAELSR